jgi:protoporphyrinogen oxidase
MKTALIIGAGPAGLTAATELLQRTDIHPIVLEATDQIGGISQTVNYHGNRMDIGGHRFFSKNERVTQWWQELMPMQGAPALDDILLQKNKPLVQDGPDPEKTDRVMLNRERVSRIFFLRKFFDYPISVKWATFAGLGLKNTFRAGFGYMKAVFHKLPETSLENFYINRFGRPLYEMFFEDYTTKVWGVHPSQIGASWGAQRVKGLSIFALLKDVLTRPFRRANDGQKNVETSLIEQFVYPKYGPGQLWTLAAERVKALGGEVWMESEVVGINIKNNQVVSVDVQTPKGKQTIPCDYCFSSMPIRDLIAAFHGITIPSNVAKTADGLPYRDFITVGVLVKKLRITNGTSIRTWEKRVPDTWIYVQERDVKVGRLQLFNNWSPYMVKNYKENMFVGMEYFCNEGDELWQMSQEDFIRMAIEELAKIDVVDPADVLDATQVKIKKAYPAYFGTYDDLPTVREFLDTIPNLWCIGRNGQHRYNNMDHSMLTAMEAVDNIAAGSTDKQNVWNVNTETEYHEQKNK